MIRRAAAAALLLFAATASPAEAKPTALFPQQDRGFLGPGVTRLRVELIGCKFDKKGVVPRKMALGCGEGEELYRLGLPYGRKVESFRGDGKQWDAYFGSSSKKSKKTGRGLGGKGKSPSVDKASFPAFAVGFPGVVPDADAFAATRSAKRAESYKSLSAKLQPRKLHCKVTTLPLMPGKPEAVVEKLSLEFDPVSHIKKELAENSFARPSGARVRSIGNRKFEVAIKHADRRGSVGRCTFGVRILARHASELLRRPIHGKSAQAPSAVLDAPKKNE